MLALDRRGFSEAAEFLAEADRSAVDRLCDTVTLTRQPAVDDLAKIVEECSSSNWDGQGAMAIERDTLFNAYVFIEALSPDCPLPRITAEPDGQINFEWYRHPRRVLSVSLSSQGKLFWAVLFGTEDPRGSCQFFGDVPKTLDYWIERIMSE